MMQDMVIDFVQGGPVDYKKMLSLGLIERHGDGYVLSSLGASFLWSKKRRLNAVAASGDGWGVSKT
jgi:hypothetical protein